MNLTKRTICALFLIIANIFIFIQSENTVFCQDQEPSYRGYARYRGNANTQTTATQQAVKVDETTATLIKTEPQEVIKNQETTSTTSTTSITAAQPQQTAITQETTATTTITTIPQDKETTKTQDISTTKEINTSTTIETESTEGFVDFGSETDRVRDLENKIRINFNHRKYKTVQKLLDQLKAIYPDNRVLVVYSQKMSNIKEELKLQNEEMEDTEIPIELPKEIENTQQSAQSPQEASQTKTVPMERVYKSGKGGFGKAILIGIILFSAVIFLIYIINATIISAKRKKEEKLRILSISDNILGDALNDGSEKNTSLISENVSLKTDEIIPETIDVDGEAQIPEEPPQQQDDVIKVDISNEDMQETVIAEKSKENISLEAKTPANESTVAIDNFSIDTDTISDVSKDKPQEDINSLLQDKENKDHIILFEEDKKIPEKQDDIKFDLNFDEPVNISDKEFQHSDETITLSQDQKENAKNTVDDFIFSNESTSIDDKLFDKPTTAPTSDVHDTKDEEFDVASLFSVFDDSKSDIKPEENSSFELDTSSDMDDFHKIFEVEKPHVEDTAELAFSKESFDETVSDINASTALSKLAEEEETGFALPSEEKKQTSTSQSEDTTLFPFRNLDTEATIGLPGSVIKSPAKKEEPKEEENEETVLSLNSEKRSVKNLNLEDPHERLFFTQAQLGDEAFEKQDWKNAIHNYNVALALKPNAEDIRKKLDIARKKNMNLE